MEATRSLTRAIGRRQAAEQHRASAAAAGVILFKANAQEVHSSCRPVQSLCAWTVQTSLALVIGGTTLAV
jgi:hypothetical protein